MLDLTDDQLLADYVAGCSQEAFAELVRRQVDLVYAAARRQVRDAHLAEDVTQSVFIVLARRARSVRRGQLVGWLLKTTRYASFNANKLQSRRRLHEREAAALKATLASTTEDAMHDKIVALLDVGLARLGDCDRTVVAMRYLQGKSIAQIAATIGATETAAQRRINRAVTKMRGDYARRGIAADAGAVMAGMSQAALCVAPAALAMNITAANGAVAASQVAAATLRTITMAKAKLAATIGVIVVMIGGAATGLVALAAAPAPTVVAAAPSAGTSPFKWVGNLLSPTTAPTFPMKFENSRLVPLINPGPIKSELDRAVTRPGGSGPAAMVYTDVAPKMVDGKFFSIPAGEMRGKKIRVSVWLKTQDVQRWVGLGVLVFGPQGRADMSDLMSDRAIYGTTDWKQYSSVVEVLEDSETILLGVGFSGTGTVWADGLEIDLAGENEPCTDDRNWHVFTRNSKRPTAGPDEKVRRNGHPTTRFSVARDQITYAYYDRGDRHVEQYLGKKIRLSAWLKCEKLTGPSGLSIHVNGPNFQKLKDDNTKGKRPLKGTMDWKKYEAIADVPMEAQSIFTGLELVGDGTIWIDEVKMEVVEP